MYLLNSTHTNKQSHTVLKTINKIVAYYCIENDILYTTLKSCLVLTYDILENEIPTYNKGNKFPNADVGVDVC